MTTKTTTLQHCTVHRAYLFTPRRYRLLAPFRAVDSPEYLVVVVGNAGKEIAIPVWRGLHDDILQQVLGYLGIDLGPDLLANSPTIIMRALARRIDALADITEDVARTFGTFTTTMIRPDVDAGVTGDVSYELTPEQGPDDGGSRLPKPKTLFDEFPEFDLAIRADGSRVGHREHWPQVLAQGWGRHGLKIRLERNQISGATLSHSVEQVVDKGIARMKEQERKRIGQSVYLKIVQDGYDVVNVTSSVPLNLVREVYGDGWTDYYYYGKKENVL